MQSKIIIALLMTLTTVIFIALFWATESGHQVAATTTPPLQPTDTFSLSADQGQRIFAQKCVACHSIGGGRQVGPDLKDITVKRDRGWLVRFITVPDKLIAQGDPIAKQLASEFGILMPNLGLSDDEAKAVLAYIEAQSQAAPMPAPTSGQNTPPASAGDTETGRNLFTGKTALKNGGPACLSCHNARGTGLIGGGSVGKDLTTTYTVIGETGIISILKTVPFPMMKEVYTAKPLTDDEIANLVAFLRSTGSTPSTSSQNSVLFFIISGVGTVLFIVIFQFLWRGRLTGVRRRLVKGGSK